mmetsp:Transcript_57560/g.124461  ORF Transcript_57560/g.124461 Transcript_57560/m.124461 type:complete len:291 (-) Transcript_57560:70-942(-)
MGLVPGPRVESSGGRELRAVAARQFPIGLPRGASCGWIVAVVAACLMQEVEGKSRGKWDRDKSGDSNAVGMTIAIFVMLLLITCGGTLWCFYLEYQPDPRRVRAIMLCVLGPAVAAELSLVWIQQFYKWMILVLLLINFWGPLDAVLRYPVVHDFETLFSLKQILLIIAKITSYAFGLKDFYAGRFWFFGLLMLNIMGLPILYFLALPLDDSPEEQRSARESVVDEDIALRVARLMTDAEERRSSWRACRRRAHVLAISAASASPLLGKVLCWLDPSYKRLLNRGVGRAV